jgi:hypothetical protein
MPPILFILVIKNSFSLTKKVKYSYEKDIKLSIVILKYIYTKNLK